MNYAKFIFGWTLLIALILSLLGFAFVGEAHAASSSVDPSCYNTAMLEDPLLVSFVADNSNPYIYGFMGDGDGEPVSVATYDIVSTPYTSPIETEITSLAFMRYFMVDYTSEEYTTHGDAVYTLWAASEDEATYLDFVTYLNSNSLTYYYDTSTFDEECEFAPPDEETASTTPDELQSLSYMGYLMGGITTSLFALFLWGIGYRGMRNGEV